MNWHILEQDVTPKNPSGVGEDRLVRTSDLVAVIDGATDKSGRDYGGTTGGARAADAVAEALSKVGATSAHDAVAAVTKRLQTLRADWDITADDLLAPSAVAAVVVPSRRQIWRVGDVHIAVCHVQNGWTTYPAEKQIDRDVARARAALLRCYLADGYSMRYLVEHDVGRDMVLPLLKKQNILANDPRNPLGFGILDGRQIPDRYIEVFDLDEQVTAVVLASDGYLTAAATLGEAEEELAADLTVDPLRIEKHAGTKAVSPGATSFDDRTYVRLCMHDDSVGARLHASSPRWHDRSHLSGSAEAFGGQQNRG